MTSRKRRQKAVIDRIEEGTWAVLLVGRNQTEKVIPVAHLPEGAKPGSWLRVRVEGDVVHDIVVDEGETQAARGRIESKLDQLRSRGQHFKALPASEIQGKSNRLQNPHPPSEEENADLEELDKALGEDEYFSPDEAKNE
jgi:hypothetical protein